MLNNRQSLSHATYLTLRRPLFLIRPLLLIAVLCLVMSPLGTAQCPGGSAGSPNALTLAMFVNTDWVAQVAPGVMKFEFKNAPQAGTLLGNGELTISNGGIEQRLDSNFALSIDPNGPCTTGTFSTFNNFPFATSVQQGWRFQLNQGPMPPCPALQPGGPGTPPTLCNPTPGSGPGTTATLFFGTSKIGTMWLLGTRGVAGFNGPACVNPADRLQQIPSPSSWTLNGADPVYKDLITFTTLEQLMGWRQTGVLSGLETITDGTFTPCPGCPKQTIVLVQGAAVNGIYDVLPDGGVFYPPFNDGNHGTCFAARFSIGGNPPASQSFDYLGYFFPPYDTAGRPINWTGVDVSTDAPNSLGNAFLGNTATATRTAP